MNTGTIISGTGHGLLIGWMLFGGLLNWSRPEPFEVADVTVISGEQFAALNAPAAAPQAEETPPDPPVIEAPEPAAPETPPEPPAPPVEAPPPEEVPISPEPIPEDTVDVAPVVPSPPAVETPPVDVPDVAAPRPAPRVAETPAPPSPELNTDDTRVEETAPSEEAAEVVPEQPPAAPPETTTTTVTEADQTDEIGLAPPTSARPKSRPARPTPPETQTAEIPEPAPAEPATPTDAVNDALAEALNGGTGQAPTGPPLTRGEKDALRVAVSQCWNVGSLSTESLGTTVIIGVKMSRDGKPDANSIEMLSFEGGSRGAAQRTYDSARRAIIRCGARGYNLPVEKYDHWRDIEMTFNPEKMRVR